jgi:hypothetical protein
MVRHEHRSCRRRHEAVLGFYVVQLFLVHVSKSLEGQVDPFLSVAVFLLVELVVPRTSLELH